MSKLLHTSLLVKLTFLALIGQVLLVSSLHAEEKGSFRTERLKWLDFDWDCEGFQDQIKARYSSFGPWEDMPDQIRGDLDIVLEVACSKRFAHCDFKNCQHSKALSPEVREKLLAERAELVKKKFADRKRLIASTAQREKKKRAQWKRFEVPGDRLIKAKGAPDEEKKDLRKKRRRSRSAWKRRSRRRSGDRSSSD